MSSKPSPLPAPMINHNSAWQSGEAKSDARLNRRGGIPAVWSPVQGVRERRCSRKPIRSGGSLRDPTRMCRAVVEEDQCGFSLLCHPSPQRLVGLEEASMKFSLVVAALLFASAAPIFAADEHHPEGKPDQAAAPPAAAAPNAQGAAMADCPMMQNQGTNAGAGSEASGTDGKAQGDMMQGGKASGGMMQGNQAQGMMQNGKMQCPMMGKDQ